jgi:hypothetical protein
MAVTYTNRKGRTYFLCKGTTKTGRTHYYFGRELKGEPVERIPEGFTISESVNGVVSLVRDRPKVIREDEITTIEEEVSGHSQGRNYKVHAKHDRIIIYEMSGPDVEGIAGILERSGLLLPGMEERIQEHLEQSSRFEPILQFILSDREQRAFRVQRWCYLGGIDDWIEIEHGSLEELALKLIPLLGTDEFFDLY